jgi:hypothetical protein
MKTSASLKMATDVLWFEMENCTTNFRYNTEYGKSIITPELYSWEFSSNDQDKSSKTKLTKLRGFGPRANFTDRETAACWRS